MNKIIDAAVIIIENENDEILIGKRAIYREDNSLRVNGGEWEFPGGKFEKNEIPITAAKREALEETGLCLFNLDFCLNKTVKWYENTYYLYVFKTKILENYELIKSNEHEVLIWCKKEELFKYNILDFDKEEIKKLLF